MGVSKNMRRSLWDSCLSFWEGWQTRLPWGGKPSLSRT